MATGLKAERISQKNKSLRLTLMPISEVCEMGGLHNIALDIPQIEDVGTPRPLRRVADKQSG